MRFYLALAFGSFVSAHTQLTNIYVNGVNQGDGTCVRQPRDANTSTNPIASPFTNPDVACGRDGQIAVAFTCPVPASAKLTFEFRENPDYARPGFIDVSHKGPMAVYLRPMASQSDNINSDGWFKIWDGGYDAATKKFADEKVMAAGDGLFSVDLPSGLPRGEYLARAEIIALHNYLDPQFFVGCAQVFVESDVTGTLSIPEGSRVKIPGYLTGSEKGLKVNIWEKIPTPYVIPGPPVYFPTAAPSSSTKGATSVSSSNGNGNKTEPEGVGIPPTCLLKNANWCGVEVPAYKNENGCWAASDNCYKQADACYKSAPPSGSKNCDVWTAKKCDALRDSCSARRFKGPEKVVLQEVFAHPVPVTKVPDAVAPVGTAVGSVSGGAGGGGGGGKAPKEVDAGSGSGAGYVTGSGSGSGVGSAAGGPSASAAGIAEKVSGSSAAQAQPSVYVGGGVAGAKKASSCSRPARHVEGKRWSA